MQVKLIAKFNVNSTRYYAINMYQLSINYYDDNRFLQVLFSLLLILLLTKLNSN